MIEKDKQKVFNDIVDGVEQNKEIKTSSVNRN
jgi:hypothetical protein